MRLAVVAADYTPGEADQLRRDMAGWRKTGRIERHRERLVGRMQKKGIAPEFGEAVFNQILGFGEYGFPESHAASFALIAYATAWLRCHYPPEFYCSLLNAQPMGFYSPATIIEDAKRTGVEMRPVDVTVSDWDCTLEPTETTFAVRIGLRYVKGLRAEAGERIVGARPFSSPPDFALKTGLGRGAQEKLAAAGALCGLGRNRRETLWELQGLPSVREHPLLQEVPEPVPRFEGLNAFESIGWDYERTGHSTRAHPLEPLRRVLWRNGLPDARTVSTMPDGKRIRYAGMVICRQRPGTANGVVFMTLEDETGFVNLVVWQTVFDRFATIAKTAAFLGVTGKLQVQDGVTHLVADSLWRPDLDVEPESAGSRDFH